MNIPTGHHHVQIDMQDRERIPRLPVTLLASGSIILLGLMHITSLLQTRGSPKGVMSSSLCTDSRQSSVTLGLAPGLISPVHSISRITRVAIFSLRKAMVDLVQVLKQNSKFKIPHVPTHGLTQV